MIVGCDVLQAFRVQLDFEEGRLVCDGVSVPMREFPDNTSEISPIEHLLQDHLDQIYNASQAVVCTSAGVAAVQHV